MRADNNNRGTIAHLRRHQCGRRLSEPKRDAGIYNRDKCLTFVIQVKDRKERKRRHYWSVPSNMKDSKGHWITVLYSRHSQGIGLPRGEPTFKGMVMVKSFLLSAVRSIMTDNLWQVWLSLVTFILNGPDTPPSSPAVNRTMTSFYKQTHTLFRKHDRNFLPRKITFLV